MSTLWIVVTVTLVYIAVGFTVWCLLDTAKNADRADGSDV